MADYSLDSGGYGDGGLGLGSSGSSGGVGLGAPSGGYFGDNTISGGGQGLQGTTDQMFSYNPSFGDGYVPSTSYSLGDLYSQNSGQGLTFDGSYGLQMPNNPYADTGVGFGGQARDDDFWSGNMGKFIKGMGRFALSTNPVGRMGLLGYDMYNAAQNKNYGGLAQGLVGAATGNGLLGAAAGIGTDAAMGKNVSGRVGSTLGSVVGGGIAGPLGSMAGGYLGSKASSNSGGYSDNTLGNVRGDGSKGLFDNPGQLAAGLGQLYLNNKAAKSAEGNVQNLNSMFGQNSAYSQQMRQQLERRDAAAGRRSQYGPREVELQAKLAEMAAEYGPKIAQSNMAAQQVAQQRRQQNLSSLYAMGRETGLFDMAKNGLTDLFSNNSSTPLYMDSNGSGTSYSV